MFFSDPRKSYHYPVGWGSLEQICFLHSDRIKMHNKHKPCIGRFYKSIVYTCMSLDFFPLFSFDRWRRIRKRPRCSLGDLLCPGYSRQPSRNFMTSPGSVTAAAGPPQRGVPCLSLNHQPSYDSQLLHLAGRDSGHSWANQPTNQPTISN